MPTLKFEIECGKETCAKEPGKFCRFLNSTGYGAFWHCYLFSKYVDPRGNCLEDLEEKDGWVQRHPECLKNCGE